VSTVHVHAPPALEYLVVKRLRRCRKWSTPILRCQAWKGNLRRCQLRALYALLEPDVREAAVLATYEYYDALAIFQVENTSR
jgi:hypothetical protein